MWIRITRVWAFAYNCNLLSVWDTLSLYVVSTESTSKITRDTYRKRKIIIKITFAIKQQPARMNFVLYIIHKAKFSKQQPTLKPKSRLRNTALMCVSSEIWLAISRASRFPKTSDNFIIHTGRKHAARQHNNSLSSFLSAQTPPFHNTSTIYYPRSAEISLIKPALAVKTRMHSPREYIYITKHLPIYISYKAAATRRRCFIRIISWRWIWASTPYDEPKLRASFIHYTRFGYADISPEIELSLKGAVLVLTRTIISLVSHIRNYFNSSIRKLYNIGLNALT